MRSRSSIGRAGGGRTSSAGARGADEVSRRAGPLPHRSPFRAAARSTQRTRSSVASCPTSQSAEVYICGSTGWSSGSAGVLSELHVPSSVCSMRNGFSSEAGRSRRPARLRRRSRHAAPSPRSRRPSWARAPVHVQDPDAPPPHPSCRGRQCATAQRRDPADRRRCRLDRVRRYPGPHRRVGGRIVDIRALQLPFDRQRSLEISQYVEPILNNTVNGQLFGSLRSSTIDSNQFNAPYVPGLAGLITLQRGSHNQVTNNYLDGAPGHIGNDSLLDDDLILTYENVVKQYHCES